MRGTYAHTQWGGRKRRQRLEWMDPGDAMESSLFLTPPEAGSRRKGSSLVPLKGSVILPIPWFQTFTLRVGRQCLAEATLKLVVLENLIQWSWTHVKPDSAIISREYNPFLPRYKRRRTGAGQAVKSLLTHLGYRTKLRDKPCAESSNRDVYIDMVPQTQDSLSCEIYLGIKLVNFFSPRLGERWRISRKSKQLIIPLQNFLASALYHVYKRSLSNLFSSSILTCTSHSPVFVHTNVLCRSLIYESLNMSFSEWLCP